jgi:hypothetical protein
MLSNRTPWHTRYKLTLSFILAAGTSWGIVEIIKCLSNQPDSHNSDLKGSPSNHANWSTLLYIALTLVQNLKAFDKAKACTPSTTICSHPVNLENVASGTALLLNVGVMAARVIANKHYISDVVTGSAIGLAIGQLISYASIYHSPSEANPAKLTKLYGSDILYFHYSLLALSMHNPKLAVITTISPLIGLALVAKSCAYTSAQEINDTDNTIEQPLLIQPSMPKPSFLEGLITKTPGMLFHPTLRTKQTCWDKTMLIYLWALVFGALLANALSLPFTMAAGATPIEDSLQMQSKNNQAASIANIASWVLTGISAITGFALVSVVDALKDESPNEENSGCFSCCSGV